MRYYRSRIQWILSVGSVIATFGLAASAGAASTCVGLACPGVLPAGSVPQGELPTLPAADDGGRDLTQLKVAGYYAVDTPSLDARRSVVYVVTPGTWNTTPSVVQGLVDHLVPAQRTTKWLVIFGKGAFESGPWAPDPAATSAASVERGMGKAARSGGKAKQRPRGKVKQQGGARAFAAGLSACSSPYFCVWTNTGYSGNQCQWQSVSVWQSMSGWSCYLNGESMANTRSAWSLIKRDDGRNYCAKPISTDSTLANNGFSNRTTDTYNSTAASKQSGWNCVN